MKLRRRRTLLRCAAGAALLYAVMALVFTWPLVLHLTDSVPFGEESGDVFQFVWDLWWVKRAAFDLGVSPWRTSLIGLGGERSLFLHTLCPLNGLLSAPIQWLVPGPKGLGLSYNVLLLANFTAAGLAVCALAFHCTRSFGASVAAGALAAFSSTRLHHLDHPNNLSLPWAALALWFLLRLLKRGRVRDGAACGLAHAALLWSSLRWTALMALLCPAWAVCSAAAARRPWKLGRGWAPPVVAVLVFAAAAAPLAEPAFEAFLLRAGMQPYSLERTESYSANAAALFAAYAPRTPLARLFGLGPYRGGDVADTRLGLVLLALVVAAAAKAPRARALPWLAAGLVFTALALGPRLQVFMHTFQRPLLPYYWLGRISPLWSISSKPERFLMVARLCLAVAAAFGAREVLRARVLRGAAAKTGAMFLLAAVLWAENCPALLHLVSLRLPPGYARIARTPGDFAVLGLSTGLGKRWLYEQTAHGKRLVQAALSHDAGRLRNRRLEERLERIALPLSRKDRDLLRRLRIRFVVRRETTPGGEVRVVCEQAY